MLFSFCAYQTLNIPLSKDMDQIRVHPHAGSIITHAGPNIINVEFTFSTTLCLAQVTILKGQGLGLEQVSFGETKEHDTHLGGLFPDTSLPALDSPSRSCREVASPSGLSIHTLRRVLLPPSPHPFKRRKSCLWESPHIGEEPQI